MREEEARVVALRADNECDANAFLSVEGVNHKRHERRGECNLHYVLFDTILNCEIANRLLDRRQLMFHNHLVLAL